MSGIFERLQRAQNAHDAQAMAALFTEDYRSTQPAHPGRAFVGRAQVLANWSSVFEGVPDFVSVLVASAADGDSAWGEWEWSGRHADGSPFAMRGVTVMVLRDGLFAEGRLYVEPVDVSDSDIEASVRQLYRPPDGSAS